MSSEHDVSELRSRCESRIAQIERRLRHLWIPGRRRWLVSQFFDAGYDAREIGDFQLAERSFLSAVRAMQGCRPRRTKKSFAVFGVIAACHNLVGVQRLELQRFSDAAAALDEAISLRRELRRLYPAERENEVFLGGALCNRGHASARDDAKAAIQFYEQSLSILRQPYRTCECSYWDEERQTWWCSQLEVIARPLGLQWVAMAPQFIDHASEGLRRAKAGLPSEL